MYPWNSSTYSGQVPTGGLTRVNTPRTANTLMQHSTPPTFALSTAVHINYLLLLFVRFHDECTLRGAQSAIGRILANPFSALVFCVIIVRPFPEPSLIQQHPNELSTLISCRYVFHILCVVSLNSLKFVSSPLLTLSCIRAHRLVGPLCPTLYAMSRSRRCRMVWTTRRSCSPRRPVQHANRHSK